VYVTITRQEYIQLKADALRWQTLHRKALGRSQWREERYQRILRELKVRCAKTEAKLRTELEFAQAKIRDLQKRLFAGKSERGKSCEAQTQGVLATHIGASAVVPAVMVAPCNRIYLHATNLSN